jgi:UDP-glucuronate 4-epimerase
MQYDEEPYAIMNVGSGQPIELNDMIDALEDVVGKDLERNHLPEQPGDVPQTWADISRAKERLSYEPQVKLRKGIRRFLDSYFADWSSQPSVAT